MSKETEQESEEDEEQESEDKEESDLDAKAKSPESDLEEALEDLNSKQNPEPSAQSFQGFMNTTPTGSPVLEKVAEAAPEPGLTLERGIDFIPGKGKGDDDKKYTTDISKDYEEEAQSKKKAKITSDMEVQFTQPTAVNMETLGKAPERLGRDFTMSDPEELTRAREGFNRDYETIQAGKSEQFVGEKTGTQEQLEKRYEFDK